MIKYEDLEIKNNLEYSAKKKSKEILKISGEWTNFLKFGDEVYWKINDYVRLPIFQQGGCLLPSDSVFRKDLISLIKNDEVNAQNFKEEYEEMQRNDRKLREKFKA